MNGFAEDNAVREEKKLGRMLRRDCQAFEDHFLAIKKSVEICTAIDANLSIDLICKQ